MTNLPAHDALADSQMQQLQQRLAVAEAALQALRDAQVDAVLDPRGSGYMLLRQTQQALARSQSRYHRLISRMSAIVFEVAPDGTVLFVNEAVARCLGYPPEVLQGRDCVPLLFPADQAPVLRKLGARLRRGDVANQEVTVTRRDGIPVTFELSTSNDYAPDGTLRRIVGLAQDITDRKTLEAAQQERARLNALCGDIGLFLTRTPVAGGTLQACAEALVRHLDVAAARIWRLDERDNMLELQASAGLASPLGGLHSRMPLGAGVIGRVAQEGRPHLSHELQREPALCDPEWVRGAGLVAAAAFPLRVEAQVLGVLALFARRTLSPATLDTLAVLADTLALGIRRSRSEAHLHQTSQTLATIIRAVPLALVSLDTEDRVRLWNPAAERIFGWREDEVLGKPLPFAAPARDGAAHSAPADLPPGSPPPWVDTRRQRRDGTPVDVRTSVVPLVDAAGAVTGSMHVFADITELKRLEEQLRQAQKMEAVGRLAGGVAHDFNNLLTIINGYSELLLGGLPASSALRLPLEEIGKAGERAAGLTRQLLAFSRKQVQELQVVDLNRLVAEVEKMLHRLLGEDIDLRTQPGPCLWPVLADPGQLQQVLMNLCINARDAMPGGGTLTISTANVHLHELLPGPYSEVRSGPYVLLSVTDTGCGMDEATRAHIFEPFFTTKGPEKGTGLGLAVVYGIVRQSGGFIDVLSEPGQGTTMKVYLPRNLDTAPERAETSSVGALPRGTETILLVEDEGGVRRLASESLRAMGYRVLEAENGRRGLEIGTEHGAAIDLVITDVIMPLLNGKQMVEQLQAVHPRLRAVYMSGYTTDVTTQQGILAPGTAFVQKPFSPATLVRYVRDVLDVPSRAQPVPPG